MLRVITKNQEYMIIVTYAQDITHPTLITPSASMTRTSFDNLSLFVRMPAEYMHSGIVSYTLGIITGAHPARIISNEVFSVPIHEVQISENLEALQSGHTYTLSLIVDDAVKKSRISELHVQTFNNLFSPLCTIQDICLDKIQKGFWTCSHVL